MARVVSFVGFVGVVVGLAVWCGACGPGVQGGDDDDTPCTEGASRCTGADFETCVDGHFTTQQTCAMGCDPVRGCLVCEPGTGTCSPSGDASQYCLPDGTGYVVELCDPVQGVMCNFETGLCQGACAPHELQKSYIGCEYYPTVTGNPVVPAMHFAVAVANASTDTATVTIEGGALTAPMMLSVAPGSVAVQTLPWHNALKLCAGTTQLDCAKPQTTGALAPDGAYHLRSTQPVTVYEFSPLEYTVGGEYSYTNDASLLLPTNAWTGNYVVAAYRRSDYGPPNTGPGLLAVTASQDATAVTINVTTATPAGGGAPAFAPGVPQTVMLNAGDVLELTAFGTWGSSSYDDLTGSIVSADKPVQVIGGHYCAFSPDSSVGYCDHLEESIFPVETLSTRYLVTAPAVPPLPNGKERVIRVIATAADTTLSYDPPQAGAATTIAAIGQYVELSRNDTDFLVSANHKVLVVEYMEGQDAGGDTGDPAMTLAVPVDQYRMDYLFHAPVNYEVNYVNVTAPTGATVTLDGAAVNGFQPIGGSGYGVARVTLGNAAAGNHTIAGDMKFGITVYGYGQYTSYWYPGGLDLAPIPIP